MSVHDLRKGVYVPKQSGVVQRPLFRRQGVALEQQDR